MPGLENDTKQALANYVEIEVAEMEHDGTYDDNFDPVLSPTEPVGDAARTSTSKSMIVERYMDGRLSTKIVRRYIPHSFISTIVTGVSVSEGMTKL